MENPVYNINAVYAVSIYHASPGNHIQKPVFKTSFKFDDFQFKDSIPSLKHGIQRLMKKVHFLHFLHRSSYIAAAQVIPTNTFQNAIYPELYLLDILSTFSVPSRI